MIKFVKKYYIQIIAVTVFFLVIIVMIVQSFNVLNMIKERSVEFKQIELDYALAEDFLNEIHKFTQNIKYIKDDNEWLQVLLPNDDDEKVKLFSSLEELAKNTGNNGISLSVSAGTTPVAKVKKGVPATEITDAANPIVDNYMNINITLVGNYNDLIYFLHKLENMQYFSDVNSLSMIKTSAGGIYYEDEDEKARNDLLKTTMSVRFYLNDNK